MLKLTTVFNNCKRIITRLSSKQIMSDVQVSEKGTFVQSLNPMTGQREWKMVADDYDYQQEVARAAFADMLHDTERNHLYYVGLKAAIEKKRSEGEEVHVLDIGTGTGLLAMMAARIGADSVTAIEEFSPMANCAEKIIALNGFSDQIRLIRKRSTEVRIGEGSGHEMKRRANILVTEVFDTELIGEGAIATFNLAHKHLLTDDCLVVPCEAVLYGQVVESDLISRWNTLHHIRIDDKTSLKLDAVTNSSSSLALHDLQLSQIKSKWFKPITEPLKVFRFNFGTQSGNPIPVNDQTSTVTKALNGGKCDAVLMWWEIFMDPEKKVLLSCAPKWAHPDPKEMPWRDHWMQAVYYPIRTPEVFSGQEISLVSNHDEYSLWFDVETENLNSIPQIPMPMPTGGIHLAVSRPRLGQINDSSRNSKFVESFKKVFEKFVAENGRLPNCLCLSEQSLLPIIAAAQLTLAERLNFEEGSNSAKVFASERNVQMKSVLQSYSAQNADLIKDRIVFLENSDISSLSPEQIPVKVDVIFGEPHFSINFLPWHNLLFWYAAQKFIQNEKVVLLPKQADLWAVPVHYEHLWKIRAPVENVEGFKMDHFDNIIMSACDTSDACVEPHPLWEYPCLALGKPTRVMSFDLTKPMPSDHLQIDQEIEIEGHQDSLNGMALWMEWRLLDDGDDVGNVVSGGPVEPVVVGRQIEWDVHSKQGVHFFQKLKTEKEKEKSVKSVQCQIVFKPEEGDFDFKFDRKFC